MASPPDCANALESKFVPTTEWRDQTFTRACAQKLVDFGLRFELCVEPQDVGQAGSNCFFATDKHYMTAIRRLKTVSGRLLELFRGRLSERVDEPVVSNLLVVDDEESICFSMSEYFSQHGFKVDTAREMEEAEGLIKVTDYKVVIQDLRLGLARHPDGLEIIRLVHKRNPETRIIVLTSYGSAEVEAEARRAGADAFLRKPKPLSQVAQVVQGLIESPRTRTVRA